MTENDMHSMLRRLFTQANSVQSTSIAFYAISDGQPSTVVNMILRTGQIVRIEAIEPSMTYRLFEYIVMKLNSTPPKSFSMAASFMDIHIPQGILSDLYSVNGILVVNSPSRVVLGLTRNLSKAEKAEIDKKVQQLNESAEKNGIDLLSI